MNLSSILSAPRFLRGKAAALFLGGFLILCLYSTAAAISINNETDFNTALQTAGSHTLAANISLGSAHSVPAGITTSINMNNFTITASAACTVNGNLTLSNSGTYLRSSGYNGTLFTVTSGGTLQLAGATINGGSSSTSTASAVVVQASGTFTMSSGSIINNYLNANGNGGAVDVAGTFTMSGGTISGNNACRGGGVSISSGGVFTMVSGTISNNTTTRYGSSGGHGGGVYTAGTFTMTSGTIQDNVSGYDGGGVAAHGGTFNFEGGVISGNSVPQSGTSENTKRNGGGIWISTSASSTLKMSGGTVRGNTAYYGGGIQVNSTNSSNAITGGTITGNTAVSFGGGLSVDKGGYVTTSNVAIVSNTASAGGGIAVYSDFSGSYADSYARLSTNTQILENTANGGEGGGVYIPLRGAVDMDGAIITRNSSTVGGGGVYIGNGFSFLPNLIASFTMTSGQLYGNTATKEGADLSSAVSSTVTIIPATSMGRPISEVDGWYWDLETDRFAATATPVEFIPNQSGALDLIAASLTTAQAPTATPTVTAEMPQTGDSSRTPLWVLVLLVSCICICLLHKKKNSHKQTRLSPTKLD